MATSAVVFFILVLVATSAAQDPYDDAHECAMYRQCRDCRSLEYCVKINPAFLQRWWVGCPPWRPWCNPYSQTCEASPTPICQAS